MRTAFVTIVLAFSACAPRATQSVRSPDAVDAVRSLDAGWARSYAMHDTAYAYQLFAEDLVVTTTNGGVKDREGEIKDIRAAPNLKMDYFRTRDVRIKTYGNAAVVTGLAEWSFVYNNQPSQVARRYTATYVRGGALGWRMVALHIGRAP